MKIKKHRWSVVLSVTALVICLSGCIISSDIRSQGSDKLPEEEAPSWQRTTMYFGLGKPKGLVSPKEFDDFVDQVVTQRFAQGLTVIAASGQWIDSHFALVEEPSRILVLVHPASPSATARIADISAIYKRRFQQLKVLVVSESVAVEFQ